MMNDHEKSNVCDMDEDSLTRKRHYTNMISMEEDVAGDTKRMKMNDDENLSNDSTSSDLSDESDVENRIVKDSATSFDANSQLNYPSKSNGVLFDLSNINDQNIRNVEMTYNIAHTKDRFTNSSSLGDSTFETSLENSGIANIETSMIQEKIKTSLSNSSTHSSEIGLIKNMSTEGYQIDLIKKEPMVVEMPSSNDVITLHRDDPSISMLSESMESELTQKKDVLKHVVLDPTNMQFYLDDNSNDAKKDDSEMNEEENVVNSPAEEESRLVSNDVVAESTNIDNAATEEYICKTNEEELVKNVPSEEEATLISDHVVLYRTKNEVASQEYNSEINEEENFEDVPTQAVSTSTPNNIDFEQENINKPEEQVDAGEESSSNHANDPKEPLHSDMKIKRNDSRLIGRNNQTETAIKNLLLSEAIESTGVENTSKQAGPSSHVNKPGPSSTVDNLSAEVTNEAIAEHSESTGDENFNRNITSSVSGLDLAKLIINLREDVLELRKKIDNQETILGAVVQANELNLTPLFAISFEEKYSLEVPLQTMDDFNKFSMNLEENSTFCKEFITSLIGCIDNNVSISKNILYMIRKYMSKELAMQFTASKPTGVKMVLKETLFCKCLLQAMKMSIKNSMLPLELERAFYKNLGTVLGGSKGWHLNHDNSQLSQ